MGLGDEEVGEMECSKTKKALRRARHPTDSWGNLYTTESCEGKRIQKFVYRGR